MAQNSIVTAYCSYAEVVQQLYQMHMDLLTSCACHSCEELDLFVEKRLIAFGIQTTYDQRRYCHRIYNEHLYKIWCSTNSGVVCKLDY